MTAMRYNWTTDQKAYMASRYLSGRSMDDIAEELGCSNRTINHHLSKMGVPMRGVGMNSPIARAKMGRENHPGWKGGRMKAHGYIHVLVPDNPNARNGYVPEHRLLMEQHLLKTEPLHPAIQDGAILRSWVVHHRNGNKSDNRLSNLQVMPRNKHNSWIHYKDEIVRLRKLLDEAGIPYQTYCNHPTEPDPVSFT